MNLNPTITNYGFASETAIAIEQDHRIILYFYLKYDRFQVLIFNGALQDLIFLSPCN